MKVLLKSDGKTVLFLSDSATLNVNDEMWQTLDVEVEVPLIDSKESLWVVFQNVAESTLLSNEIMLERGDDGHYRTLIPDGVIAAAGDWTFQLFTRTYDTVDTTLYKQVASDLCPFTIESGLPLSGSGTAVTNATIGALYAEALAKINAEADNVPKKSGDVGRLYAYISNTTSEGEVATLLRELYFVARGAQEGYIATYVSNSYGFSDFKEGSTISNGYNLTIPVGAPKYDAHATPKWYVDKIEASLAEKVTSVYRYKGSVPTEGDLPTTGSEVGDVYDVEDTGDNYSWTGSKWDKLSGDWTKKLDKQTPTTLSVYVANAKGEQYMIPIYVKAIANGVVLRDANGDILVSETPQSDNAAISKAYLESVLNSLDFETTIDTEHIAYTNKINDFTESQTVSGIDASDHDNVLFYSTQYTGRGPVINPYGNSKTLTYYKHDRIERMIDSVSYSFLIPKDESSNEVTIASREWVKAQGYGSGSGTGGTELPSITEADDGKVLTAEGGAWVAKALPTYSGDYEVVPATTLQTLDTGGKLMQEDVTVAAIPYQETSNLAGGTTVNIG